MEQAAERWVAEWYALDVEGTELRYPALPVELAQEHFVRHREDVAPIQTYAKDGTVYHRTVEAEGRVEKRDATITYTVMNRLPAKEDVLRVDAMFPDEHVPEDPAGYVDTLREHRMETLLADVEAVYEAAKTAAYMVPAVREKLVANSNAPDGFTLEETVERSREKAQRYYGDMPGDTLITPLAWYLEEGREGRVAPFSHAFSGSEQKKAKEGKGRELIDTYYDVMEDCVDVLHDG